MALMTPLHPAPRPAARGPRQPGHGPPPRPGGNGPGRSRPAGTGPAAWAVRNRAGATAWGRAASPLRP
ncbi:hypothetical protein CAG99_20340 [Streptomyces marincola]|uniref:Uncharacterized protein n=1 Tax=Streptomyces marincola TaxID=2878388 RepID=A0A1W7D1T6_9ACTN|nr:hypothetical protein CAG99_20340 [Streptomyces marincola]